MENNQSAQYLHLYGAPALPPPSSVPLQPSAHPYAYSNPPLPVLPIVPIPTLLPSSQVYALYPPVIPAAASLTSQNYLTPLQPLSNTLVTARVASSRGTRTASRSQSLNDTDTTPSDTQATSITGSITGSLPQKPKKAKTPARLAREMARKLKHRERRRMGRRERRNTTKKGEGAGEDMIALEGASDLQSDGELDEGSESGEIDIVELSESMNGEHGFKSNAQSGLGPSKAPFNPNSLLDYGSPESSGEVGIGKETENNRRQSITMSDAESGAASSIDYRYSNLDGPNDKDENRGSVHSGSGDTRRREKSPRVGLSQDFARRNETLPNIPTGLRFQPPSGPRNPDVYRFGDRGDRGNDRSRREEDGFRFEIDSRGLQFPATDTVFRERRFRDGDRRHGDRRGFHTDSGRRYGDRDRDGGERRGPWVPLPAHDRPILHVRRSATPEQFPAMVAAKRQRLDEEGEAEMDIDSSDGSGIIEDNAILLPTSLPEDNQDTPPIEMATEEKSIELIPGTSTAVDGTTDQSSTTGKKMDVIAMIRQAKKELLGNRKDTSAASGDFISLSGLDEETGNQRRAEQTGKPIPTGPKFSHKDYLHAQSRDTINKPLPIDRGVAPGTTTVSQPLPPPPGLTDSAKKKRTYSEMEPAPFVNTQYPWINPVKHSKSLYSSVWLHKEIIDFYSYIKPKPYEHAVRHDLVQRLRNAIRVRWPDADIRSFGSFAAEIYLPSSDMDVVFLSEQFLRYARPKYDSANHIRNVVRLLRSEGIGENVVPILGAKVPIIKYKDKLTGLSVDISFENSSGLVANRTFRQWKEVYPDLPKLALLLKHFLALRGKNEPFNGGLGSFSLICMIVSLLQLMPEASSGNWHDTETVSLGRLLMEFLDLYGNKFNTTTTGIKVREPGYFKKTTRPKLYNPNKIWCLSIEDPNDPNNNIAKATYRIEEVLEDFSGALVEINHKLNAVHSMSFEQRKYESLLAPMIGNYNYDIIEHLRAASANAFLRAGMGDLQELVSLGGRDPQANDQKSKLVLTGSTSFTSMAKPAVPKEQKKFAKKQRRAALVRSRGSEKGKASNKPPPPATSSAAPPKKEKKKKPKKPKAIAAATAVKKS